ALGAREVCEREEDRRVRNGRLGAVLLIANALAFLVVPGLARLAAVDWRWAFALVSVATALLGAIFPLVCHASVVPDDAGPGVARLYVANIVGSVAGTVVTGFALLDVLETRSLCLLLALVGAVTSTFPLAAALRWRRAALLTTGGCVVLLALSLPAFDRVY